jgi:hypothetical protein
MVRRLLVALVLVAAGAATGVAPAQAAPASLQCPGTDGTDTGVVVPLSSEPATVSVRSTSTGALVPVVVTFVDGGTGFTIASASASTQDEVLDASWCAKAAKGNTAPVLGTGTNVSGAVVGRKGEALRLDHVTLYSVTTPPLLVVCLDSSLPGTADLSQAGPLGAPDNLAVHDSTDGTCSLPTPVRRTMVGAGSSTEADAACLGLGTPGVAGATSSFGYPVADGFWLCAVAV